ncbi:hypothetical protein GCM10022222_38510 [Amycolatopsis ultiminotia]|uniref:Uncharacterized protein n=1 Tax=Amycolatopsis ultiminotia TaxID=543629 RepID=A0ABP6WMF1_9PSEU
MDLVVGFGAGVGQKCTCVAAVEEYHDATAPAGIHLLANPIPVDRGRGEPSCVGIPHDEVQVAVVVLDSMARNVRKTDIVGGGFREESVDRDTNFVSVFVVK